MLLIKYDLDGISGLVTTGSHKVSVSLPCHQKHTPANAEHYCIDLRFFCGAGLPALRLGKIPLANRRHGFAYKIRLPRRR